MKELDLIKKLTKKKVIKEGFWDGVFISKTKKDLIMSIAVAAKKKVYLKYGMLCVETQQDWDAAAFMNDYILEIAWVMARDEGQLWFKLYSKQNLDKHIAVAIMSEKDTVLTLINDFEEVAVDDRTKDKLAKMRKEVESGTDYFSQPKDSLVKKGEGDTK